MVAVLDWLKMYTLNDSWEKLFKLNRKKKESSDGFWFLCFVVVGALLIRGKARALSIWYTYRNGYPSRLRIKIEFCFTALSQHSPVSVNIYIMFKNVTNYKSYGWFGWRCTNLQLVKSMPFVYMYVCLFVRHSSNRAFGSKTKYGWRVWTYICRRIYKHVMWSQLADSSDCACVSCLFTFVFFNVEVSANRD